ncbi:hypothetical protein HanRHA438_Chr12g0536771 [Helianthus annuus]|nr:hypothetical protein HanOQP8_Chr12g0433201 [Helianthus annuus]KAJ0865084.1 hypothetical protein HanRHA438_Chr12g0536771 [Helianthus annuus]
MDYNFRRLDTQRQYTHVSPTSSFNYPYVSDHPMTEGLSRGRSEVTRDAIQRELMKEMIREQILTEELQRCRFLELRHGEPEIRRIRMPVQEIRPRPLFREFETPCFDGSIGRS